MMSKPRMIERTKNFSLVVLFLSTVLLLYFFWGNITFDRMMTPSGQSTGKSPEIVNMIKPEEITVNFGSDNYTVVNPGKLWYNKDGGDSFVGELGKFGPAENILVEEIPYDKYQKVMKLKSIWAEFNYDIPISDFCSNFKMKRPQSYDVIEAVTAIGYSTAEDGKSLYIYDGKNQKYYRLLMVADPKDAGSSSGMEFSALIDSIATEGYSIYYPIGSVAGVVNDRLVPISLKANLESFPFRQDTYSYQTEKINTLAERFFGENFAFVRTLTEESGTVIYMYGYGQNVLIVNTDGTIEYKEDQIGGHGGESFSEALETAVDFVAAHGSWESLEGAELTPYLKDVIPDPNKKEGYRFVFGMEVNGSRLFYEDGDPIIVDVLSGQVTYYKRQLIDFDQEEIEAMETAVPEDAFSAVNLIAQNYKYIYDILLQVGEVNATADPAVMFEDVASLVNNMQVGYLKQSDKELTEIRPVWAVTMKSGTEVYFDLYGADPIGYSAD